MVRPLLTHIEPTPPTQASVCKSVVNRFEIDGEEVLDGEVKPFGNSAHVTVPKRWRGANVKVVRTSEPTEQDEE